MGPRFGRLKDLPGQHGQRPNQAELQHDPRQGAECRDAQRREDGIDDQLRPDGFGGGNGFDDEPQAAGQQ